MKFPTRVLLHKAESDFYAILVYKLALTRYMFGIRIKI